MMMMRQWGISWSFWKLRVQSIAIVELPEETPWQRLFSHRRRQSAPMAVVHILSFSLLLTRNYNSLKHTSMLPSLSLSLSLSLSRSTPKQFPLILKYFPFRCPWDLFLPRAEIPVLTKEKTHQPVPLPRPHKHTGKNCQSERSKGEEAPNVYKYQKHRLLLILLTNTTRIKDERIPRWVHARIVVAVVVVCDKWGDVRESSTHT
jgi:hypothetical protein